VRLHASVPRSLREVRLNEGFMREVPYWSEQMVHETCLVVQTRISRKNLTPVPLKMLFYAAISSL
jgi:hypothetical protein